MCEDAKQLVVPILNHFSIALKEVEITDDDALVERYGVRIPVLSVDGAQAELQWPFTGEDIVAFVEAQVLV